MHVANNGGASELCSGARDLSTIEQGVREFLDTVAVREFLIFADLDTVAVREFLEREIDPLAIFDLKVACLADEVAMYLGHAMPGRSPKSNQEREGIVSREIARRSLASNPTWLWPLGKVCMIKHAMDSL